MLEYLDMRVKGAQGDQRHTLQGGELDRREDPALHEREVDLDLVEPAGVARCVDRDQGGSALLEPSVPLQAAMRRGVFARVLRTA